MATVTGLTANRMLELADENIVGAAVVSDRLILTRRDGTTFDAGLVKGNPGDPGSPGSPGSPGLSGVGPTGSVSMFAGAAAPSGHLLCDGAAVSRTTYQALYNIIGTTYGVGDNSTTFNLPNLKGRIPVGRDATQTEFDVLGETAGVKTHTLSAAEMPVHTHVQNSHSHTQDAHNHTQTGHDHTTTNHSHGPTSLTGFMTYGTVGRTRVAAGTTTDRIAITATATTELGIADTITGPGVVNPVTTIAVNQSTTATSQATTPTNQNTGSGSAHNNLQPYIVLNYIIKT